ncbi:MAG: hypothetical protein KGL39_46085 [Patescibacteria group bacterium]|nr:hypothetical protein [Patescibacteria group bacterium]
MSDMGFAPCIPLWLVVERDAEMQIEEQILKCIGFIGESSPAGFVADGTCFLVRVTEEGEWFAYLVTARHLVRPHRFGREELPLDGKVHIRFSRRDKPPKIIETLRSDWFPHPDRHVDVCIYPFNFRLHDADGDLDTGTLALTTDGDLRPILYSPEEEKISGPIQIGDDVFFPSVFSGHVGEKENIPVVRIGHVAAISKEGIRAGSPTKGAYLIETKSLGGSSGAPVFLHLRPLAPRGLIKHQSVGPTNRIVPYALIGIVLGAHSGSYRHDILTDNEGTITAKDADFNAGLSVVLPIQHAMDIIDGEPMKTARANTIKMAKAISGYRPSSARGDASDAVPVGEDTSLPSGANPNHREDFNSLASAAAKRKPADDRT